MGLKGSCFPLSPLVDWRTQLTIASQVIYGTLCPFVAGDVVSNVVSYVTTPGSGTPPTGIYVAIYSTAGVQQAVSANLASSAIWTNSTAGVNSPFEPAPISWTCPTTGVYYLCFLQNGTWGTTAMRFDAGNQGGWVRYNNLSGGNAISVTQSSQATFPTPATFSGNPNTVWFGWN